MATILTYEVTPFPLVKGGAKRSFSGMEKAASNNALKSDVASVASASSSTASRPRSRNRGSETDEWKKEYKIGDKVLVIYRGCWHAASVVRKEKEDHPENPGMKVDCYLIHYPNWGKKHDEWLMPDSMMHDTEENRVKADAENDEHYEKNPTVKPVKPLSSQDPQVKSKGGKGTKRAVSKDGSKEKSVVVPPDEPEQVSVPLPTPPVTPKIPGKRKKVRGPPTMVPLPSTPSLSQAAITEVPALTNQDQLKEMEQVDSKKIVVPPPPESIVSDSASHDMGQEEQPAAEPERKKPRIERNPEDRYLLQQHYDAFDPSNPAKRTATEKQLILDTLTALGMIPSDEVQLIRTVEEKKDVLMKSFRKLAFVNYANQRKLHDEAIMRVTLPQNLKCVMAENYIESIDNGMILRLPEEEKSVKVILEKYREYAEKSVPEGRSIYWQKARLAEVKNLLEHFSKFFPAIALRQEWPFIHEHMKHKTHYLRCGLIHLTRAIQLMVHLFNMEGKRLAGTVGKGLEAIYDDILQFIDREFVPGFQEEGMYFEPDDEYLKKIKFSTFEKDTESGNSVLYVLHFLPDSFFDELTNTPEVRDESLKVVWRRTAASTTDV